MLYRTAGADHCTDLELATALVDLRHQLKQFRPEGCKIWCNSLLEIFFLHEFDLVQSDILVALLTSLDNDQSPSQCESHIDTNFHLDHVSDNHGFAL